MPKLLFGYDAHDPNSAGLAEFKECMKARGWVDFIVYEGYYTHLPNTTLVANKTLQKMNGDIDAATEKAVGKDAAFVLTKTATTFYQVMASVDINRKPASEAQKAIFKYAMGGDL